MGARNDASAAEELASEDLFSHVLVGIDDTPESLIAAAQAGALRAPGGRLVLVAVAERYLAAHAGGAALTADDHVAAHTSDDLERARQLVDADEAVYRTGRLVPALRAECKARGASLLAVGVRSHRLLPARVLGGHDMEALHDADCSLLVARPGWGPHRPERVVVAVDGSAASRDAEASARALAKRIGCDLVPVIGVDDVPEPEALRAEREDGLLVPGRLVDAVAGVSTPASLVVVGAPPAPRGRRERAFLERVLFGVRCSVLIVRTGSTPVS